MITKVVCISTFTMYYPNYNYEIEFIKGEIYNMKIDEYYYSLEFNIQNEIGLPKVFIEKYFITLANNRDLTINKILND